MQASCAASPDVDASSPASQLRRPPPHHLHILALSRLRSSLSAGRQLSGPLDGGSAPGRPCGDPAVTPGIH